MILLTWFGLYHWKVSLQRITTNKILHNAAFNQLRYLQFWTTHNQNIKIWGTYTIAVDVRNVVVKSRIHCSIRFHRVHPISVPRSCVPFTFLTQRNLCSIIKPCSAEHDVSPVWTLQTNEVKGQLRTTLFAFDNHWKRLLNIIIICYYCYGG